MFETDLTFFETLLVCFEAIGKLFLVVLVGFIFVRRKWMTDVGLNNLSRLTIDVVVPCALSVSMMKGLNSETITSTWPFLMLLPIFIAFTVLIMMGMYKIWPGGDGVSDRAAAAMAAFPNSFYIPFPLALAITPPDLQPYVGMLVGAAVLAINPLQWTLGTWLVMGEKGGSRRWKESLKHTLNAPVVGTIGGSILALVPGFPEAARGEAGSFMPLRMVLQSMELIGQAMAPLAMIIIGGLIAGCTLRRAASFRLLAPIILFRFLIVPGIVLLIVSQNWLPISGIVVFILLLEAASPPAMNLTVVARRYGGDWDVISGIQLIVSILALITLPIWMTVGLMLQ